MVAATSSVGLAATQAVGIALNIASQPQPELNLTLATPTVISSELMTLREALQRATDSDSVPSGMEPGSPVWFVTLRGEWVSAFPRPTREATQEPYRHMSIVIDAESGDMLFSSAYR